MLHTDAGSCMQTNHLLSSPFSHLLLTTFTCVGLKQLHMRTYMEHTKAEQEHTHILSGTHLNKGK